NMREADSDLWRNRVTTNRWVWGALVLCVGLLLAAAHVPVLARVLDVVPPDPSTWALILGISLVPLVLGQILKALRWV
ncbi:MAG TPA: cation-translocating P-type ATPase C-terminal domain-containing protein, partial [Candidatus Krumholzibacteria bacterium]|nr:cation-translocating P-type ATPase C-terminal domain-containing protein [Candidatus Krumholzibacteria bacterium]